MSECIVKINHNCIYLPKKFLQEAGFKQNERVILRVTKHGMAFCKVSVINDIELFFNDLDDGLQNLFVKQKNKELNNR